jgi:hypothetical protein
MTLIALLLLNIFFVIALWHMDVTSNEDRLGAKLTRGIFKIPPETAYRLAEYLLIGILFAIDILFVFSV